MKIRVTYMRENGDEEKKFEKKLDKFMKENGFYRWASGCDMESNERDIGYDSKQKTSRNRIPSRSM